MMAKLMSNYHLLMSKVSLERGIHFLAIISILSYRRIDDENQMFHVSYSLFLNGMTNRWLGRATRESHHN